MSKSGKSWKITQPKQEKSTFLNVEKKYSKETSAKGNLLFSFSMFDRQHELFNLGSNTSDGIIEAKWFIHLLDCLKEASRKSIQELKNGTYDLHPVKWEQANTKQPDNLQQYNFWQFRINKSRGRVIGALIEGVFYIVWLDCHHNLTNSEGYGKARKYPPPKL
ncbi:MAG: hypothetical protein K6G50_04010 [bacterium]|nr:hypothetical protein [bacterium]